MELSDVFNDMERYKRYGCTYYKVIDFIQQLSGVEDLSITEDVVLTPFYLLPNSTYELYDYEVYFLNVKQSRKEEYILRRTGKKHWKKLIRK